MSDDAKLDVQFRVLSGHLSGDPPMQVLVHGLPIGEIDWDPDEGIMGEWRADLNPRLMRTLGLVELGAVHGKTMLALRDRLLVSLRRMK